MAGQDVFLGSDVDQVGFDGIISGSANNEINFEVKFACGCCGNDN